MFNQKEFDVNVQIDWIVRSDLPSVLEIEQSSFEFPWSEDEFLRCLRQRNCIGMVAKYNKKVVGFMIYELHRDQINVLNFSVGADVRRRGIGQQMGNKLLGNLTPQRRNRISLEIRETNLAAQLFFRNLGFQAISVLRDYYHGTVEDAYVMQYELPGEPASVTNRISNLTKRS